MRIVAGKFRRRKLLTNPGLVTRPITDRAKEHLFERLGDRVKGRRVADVFAGTGTLGLEALSRGAEGVVFIESDRRAFGLLQKNIQTLKVEDRTLCWPTDALRTSFRPKGVPHLLPFDLVFFDPPYRMISNLNRGKPLYKSLERLGREEVTSSQVILLLRTPMRASFEYPPGWKREKIIEISSMEIHWFVKEKVPR